MSANENSTIERPSEGEVLAALERIKSDPAFSGANRLVELLDYIVKSNLAEPKRKVFAKNIAEELYDRALDQDSDNHNVVRVDAGRLRRRLAEYYAGSGRDDPILIHVDPGGYVPRFELREPPRDEPVAAPVDAEKPKTRARMPYVLLPAVTGALGVGVLIGSLMQPPSVPLDREPAVTSAPVDQKSEAEWRARMAKSPSSQQAVSLAEYARNLILPMFEQEQVELALAMFRRAIRKDETYFGGYAGAAQSLAALSLFMPDGAERNQRLEEARRMVDRAEHLSTTHPWTQAALSWVYLEEMEIERAKEHAEIALDLAPNDGNILDFSAMVMLRSGEFEKARQAAQRDRDDLPTYGRYTHRSILGAANFHLGDHQAAIDALTAASASGDPISAPTLAYLAAAYQALGEQEKAHRHISDLMETWPGFTPPAAFGRLYANPADAEVVSNMLQAAGWTEINTSMTERRASQ